MRISGRLLASVFEMLDGVSLAGMSTMQVNDLVERFITDDLAARPASKGQYGFKYVLNCSINEVVCHGVPDAGRIISEGDIITRLNGGPVSDMPAFRSDIAATPPGSKVRLRVWREGIERDFEITLGELRPRSRR